MLQQRVLQQHGVLQQYVLLMLLLLLLLRALQQQEEVVAHTKPSDRVVGGAEYVNSGYWLCASHGPKAAVPRNPDGEKQRQTTINVQKHRQRMHMPFLVRDKTWAGLSNPWASRSNPRAGPRSRRAGPYQSPCLMGLATM